MNKVPIRADVTIRLAAPFHVGGGKGGSSTSSYLVRDGNGAPYWPGSAFKGKVRHYARLLYEGASADNKCEFEHCIENFGSGGESGNDESVTSCACMVCSMFGTAGNSKGNLLFGDMTPEADEISTEMRTGNAIDRYRRTAKDESLFQIETASVDVLTGQITGMLSKDNYDEECELLKAAIEAIQYIGGNTGRGLGWIKEDGIEVNICKEKGLKLPSVETESPTHVKLSVTITTESPLLIGARTSESNFRTTLQHIPGAVVRAALAQALIAQDGGAEKNKINWVDDKGGAGQFPSLRRAFGSLQITQFLPKGCRIAPMTASHFKYGDYKDKSFDTLFGGAQNDEPTERVKGFIDIQGELSNPHNTMVVTKSAMNRFSGTSQDEMLFSMEVISPPAIFEGTISGEFEPEEFERLIAKGIQVGGYQTAGYGRCSVEFAKLENTCKDIGKKELNERIKACDGKIPITLLSDAIVSLESAADISDESYLQAYQEALFADWQDIKVTKVVAQHAEWRGFDTSKSKGFLNEPVHVIKAGSVFLLEPTECSDMDALIEKMYTLQETGICQEKMHNFNGYGQVVVADEYHLQGGF